MNTDKMMKITANHTLTTRMGGGILKSRFYKILQVVCLGIILLPNLVFAQTKFGNTSITKNSDGKFEINTAAQLVEFSEAVNNGTTVTEGLTFILTNDIDMSTIGNVIKKITETYNITYTITGTKQTGKNTHDYWPKDTITSEITSTKNINETGSKTGTESSFTVTFGKKMENYQYVDVTHNISTNGIDGSQDLKGFDTIYDNYYNKDNSTFTVYKNVKISYTVKKEVKTEYINITGFSPIGTYAFPFKGRFDGQGHTIKNLNINLPSQDNVGLFGVVNYMNNSNWSATDISSKLLAAVEGISLENASIIGNNKVGGIVGFFQKGQYVKDCNVTNSLIKGNTTVGGIIGEGEQESSDGLCSNNENVTVDGNAFGKYPKLMQCYVRNDDNSDTTSTYIEANNWLGGLIGKARLTIEDCYIVAQIRVQDTAGSVTIGPIDGGAGKLYTDMTSKSGKLYYTSDVSTMLSGSTLENYDKNNKDSDALTGTPATQEQIQNGTVDLGNLKKDIYGMNGGWPMTDAQWQLLCGADIKLYHSHWNLFGPTTNGKVAMLNQNKQKADMAALKYNYDKNDWSGDYLYANEDNLELGHGYFVWPFDMQMDMKSSRVNKNQDGSIDLQIGKCSLTSVDVSLSNTGAVNSENQSSQNKGIWYALSNPFSSTGVVISGTDAGNIQGNGWIYTYDAKTDKWNSGLANYTAIEQGQGFMVATKNNKNSLNVTLTPKAESKKKSDKNDQLITFTVAANETSTNCYALINESADNGFDGNDAYMMISNNNEELVEPYFTVDNRDLVKNEFAVLPYTTDINFHASQATEATLSVNNVPANVDVYVLDPEGNSTLISDGSEYKFTVLKGENAGKYKVKFAKSVSIEQTQQVNVLIWNKGSQIGIAGNHLMNVKMMTLTGQEIFNKNINTNEYRFESPCSKGTFILSVTTDEGTKTEKIIIN